MFSIYDQLKPVHADLFKSVHADLFYFVYNNIRQRHFLLKVHAFYITDLSFLAP